MASERSSSLISVGRTGKEGVKMERTIGRERLEMRRKRARKRGILEKGQRRTRRRTKRKSRTATLKSWTRRM